MYVKCQMHLGKYQNIKALNLTQLNMSRLGSPYALQMGLRRTKGS